MKRSVIQLAGKTMVVSLPMSWVQTNSVLKGDELDITEIPEGLLVRRPQKKSGSKVEVDVSCLSSGLGRFVGALYKKGYDEFTLSFKTAEQLDKIQSEVRRVCTGFHILSQTKSSVTIKQIAHIANEEFEAVFRRLLFFVEQMSEAAQAALTSDDLDDRAKVVAMDDVTNQLADICRRTLNVIPQASSKTHARYYIVEQFERIGDDLKLLCKSKTLLSKLESELLKDLRILLHSFHELLYNFSLQGYEGFVKQKELVQKQFSSIPASVFREQLFTLFTDIFDMNGSLLVIHI